MNYKRARWDSFVKSEIESEIAVANAQRQIAQNPAAEPVVTILWSESPHLKDGQQMPLHEAEAVFKELDSARRHEREQLGYTAIGTTRPSSALTLPMQGQPDNYEGRQDFGDGDGSLIQHIRGYHEYYAQDESWKPCAAPLRGRRHGRRTRPSGICFCMSSSRIWSCIAIWPLWSRRPGVRCDPWKPDAGTDRLFQRGFGLCKRVPPASQSGPVPFAGAAAACRLRPELAGLQKTDRGRAGTGGRRCRADDGGIYCL